MLTLYSPAKVNLFLRVLGRRPDGYHELASLFQIVDLCDTLQYELAPKDSLTCSDEAVPTDNSNLIIRAAELFRRKTGRDFGLKVHLEKRIPMNAGLGGGSSNAATTLWAINQLLGMPVTAEALKEWSAELGADVPFFFSLGTAYCTGRGDCFTPLPKPARQKLWLVKPEQGLQTPAIYRRYRSEEAEGRDPVELLESHLKGVPEYCNDLEEPAFAIFPKLALIKERMLQAGFRAVSMTGSGSTLMCIGDSTPPKSSGVWSQEVSFLNRADGRWYGERP